MSPEAPISATDFGANTACARFGSASFFMNEGEVPKRAIVTLTRHSCPGTISPPQHRPQPPRVLDSLDIPDLIAQLARTRIARYGREQVKRLLVHFGTRHGVLRGTAYRFGVMAELAPVFQPKLDDALAGRQRPRKFFVRPQIHTASHRKHLFVAHAVLVMS